MTFHYLKVVAIDKNEANAEFLPNRYRSRF